MRWPFGKKSTGHGTVIEGTGEDICLSLALERWILLRFVMSLYSVQFV